MRFVRRATIQWEANHHARSALQTASPRQAVTLPTAHAMVSLIYSVSSSCLIVILHLHSAYCCLNEQRDTPVQMGRHVTHVCRDRTRPSTDHRHVCPAHLELSLQKRARFQHAPACAQRAPTRRLVPLNALFVLMEVLRKEREASCTIARARLDMRRSSLKLPNGFHLW